MVKIALGVLLGCGQCRTVASNACCCKPQCVPRLLSLYLGVQRSFLCSSGVAFERSFLLQLAFTSRLVRTTFDRDERACHRARFYRGRSAALTSQRPFLIAQCCCVLRALTFNAVAGTAEAEFVHAVGRFCYPDVLAQHAGQTGSLASAAELMRRLPEAQVVSNAIRIGAKADPKADHTSFRCMRMGEFAKVRGLSPASFRGCGQQPPCRARRRGRLWGMVSTAARLSVTCS